MRRDSGLLEFVGARGQADGDVPSGADTRALAAYVMSVQYGLSLQARDGATREELDTWWTASWRDGRA